MKTYVNAFCFLTRVESQHTCETMRERFRKRKRCENQIVINNIVHQNFTLCCWYEVRMTARQKCHSRGYRYTRSPMYMYACKRLRQIPYEQKSLHNFLLSTLLISTTCTSVTLLHAKFINHHIPKKYRYVSAVPRVNFTPTKSKQNRRKNCEKY